MDRRSRRRRASGIHRDRYTVERYRALAAAARALTFAAALIAATAKAALGTPDDAHDAFYAVTLNGAPVSDGSAVLIEPDGTVLATLGDAHAWRIVVPPSAIVRERDTDYVAFARIGGATIQLDRERSVLNIVLPADMYSPQIIDTAMRERLHAPTTIGHGGYLNYEAHAGAGADAFTSLALTAGIVNGDSALSGGAVTTWSGGIRSITRVPVAYVRDSEIDALQTIAGETYTSGGSLGGSAAFAGVHRGTDPARESYLSTSPDETVTGQLDAPAAVTVFANHQSIFQGNILPGPYAIVLPSLAGGGTLETVYRDSSGIEHRVVRQYLNDPTLLIAGRSEYGIDAGFLSAPGTTAYSVTRPFADVSQRYGVNDHFTRELYADAGVSGGHLAYALDTTVAGAFLARAGANVALGAAAGADVSAGIGISTRRLNVYAQFDAATPRFSVLGSGLHPNGASANVTYLVSSATSLTLGTTYERRDALTQKSWTFGFSTHIAGGNLSVIAGPDITGARSAELTFTRTFGRISAIAASGPNGAGTLQVVAPARTAGGISSSAFVAPAETSLTLTQQTSLADQALTLDMRPTANSVGYNLDGSIAVVGGRPYFGREANASFAIVEVPGAGDVRIFVNDQLAGRTDRTGRLFLSTLIPYQPARIRIDGSDVPIDSGLQHLETTIVPAGRGAVTIRFGTAIRSVIAMLDGPPGAPIVPGSTATLRGTQTVIPIGDGGVIYLDDIRSNHLVLDVVRDEAPCSAVIDVAAKSTGIIDLGHVACR